MFHPGGQCEYLLRWPRMQLHSEDNQRTAALQALERARDHLHYRRNFLYTNANCFHL